MQNDNNNRYLRYLEENGGITKEKKRKMKISTIQKEELDQDQDKNNVYESTMLMYGIAGGGTYSDLCNFRYSWSV